MKTALVLPGARPARYADWEQTLGRYSWLVKEAMRDPGKMFDPPPLHYCKVCGQATPRNDWPAHVKEHAQQLGIKKDVPKFDGTPVTALAERVVNALHADTVAMVADTIAAKNDDGLTFGVEVGMLSDLIANVLGTSVMEGNAGVPPFCADCAD